MGYNTTAFIETPDDDLLCSVCKDVFESPVNLKCGHTFCKECLEGWFATPVCVDMPSWKRASCPTCRSQSFGQNKYYPIHSLEQIINKLHVRCKNHEEHGSSEPDDASSSKEGGASTAAAAPATEAAAAAAPPEEDRKPAAVPAWKRLAQRLNPINGRSEERVIENGSTEPTSSVARLPSSTPSSSSSSSSPCRCSWTGTLGDWKAHSEKVCPLQKICCDVEGCTWKGFRKDYDDHFQSNTTRHKELEEEAKKRAASRPPPEEDGTSQRKRNNSQISRQERSSIGGDGSSSDELTSDERFQEILDTFRRVRIRRRERRLQRRPQEQGTQPTSNNNNEASAEVVVNVDGDTINLPPIHVPASTGARIRLRQVPVRTSRPRGARRSPGVPEMNTEETEVVVNVDGATSAAVRLSRPRTSSNERAARRSERVEEFEAFMSRRRDRRRREFERLDRISRGGAEDTRGSNGDDDNDNRRRDFDALLGLARARVRSRNRQQNDDEGMALARGRDESIASAQSALRRQSDRLTRQLDGLQVVPERNNSVPSEAADNGDSNNSADNQHRRAGRVGRISLQRMRMRTRIDNEPSEGQDNGGASSSGNQRRRADTIRRIPRSSRQVEVQGNNDGPSGDTGLSIQELRARNRAELDALREDFNERIRELERRRAERGRQRHLEMEELEAEHRRRVRRSMLRAVENRNSSGDGDTDNNDNSNSNQGPRPLRFPSFPMRHGRDPSFAALNRRSGDSREPNGNDNNQEPRVVRTRSQVSEQNGDSDIRPPEERQMNNTRRVRRRITGNLRRSSRLRAMQQNNSERSSDESSGAWDSDNGQEPRASQPRNVRRVSNRNSGRDSSNRNPERDVDEIIDLLDDDSFSGNDRSSNSQRSHAVQPMVRRLRRRPTDNSGK